MLNRISDSNLANGQITNRFFVTVDVYYNRMKNFISGCLPGVNANYSTWSSSKDLPDDLKQYTGLVDSMVYGALTPQDRARFTTYEDEAAFIVSNTNLGLVEQFGVEVSAQYSLTNYLQLTANYAYYHANLLDAKRQTRSSQQAVHFSHRTRHHTASMLVPATKCRSVGCLCDASLRRGFALPRRRLPRVRTILCRGKSQRRPLCYRRASPWPSYQQPLRQKILRSLRRIEHPTSDVCEC
ncbi:MAG: TonB-dependent receptor [Ignavibacteria bacterium]|nr:TonB-dependent receptor [Ignavibacteria bacterium]